jgi:16S rRNA (guanine1207-N2)-methyltransferase
LQWPGRGIFLRARAGQALLQMLLPGLVCEQTFKSDANALQAAGCVLAGPDDTQRYPLVLVLPPRQRDEARALLARALDKVQPAGRIVACAANTEGARSLEADLAQLCGPLTTVSKHKCRVFWSGPMRAGDSTLCAQWRALDAIRPIAAGRFVSRPGVFAWDRIDVGSALLVEQLPRTLRGRVADLGAGFGYLAAELAARCNAITALDLYEAEQRALDLARLNLASCEARIALGYHWHDVTSGLPQDYDVIVTNPPFHVSSGSSRPDIGRRFIAAAAQALRRGGRLWLVANRHLAYENTLTAAGLQTRMVVQRHGYKIIEAVRT